MDSLVADTQKRMDKALLRYATGKVDARTFGSGIEALLNDRHARAATLGRQRAGDPRARNSMDDAFGRVVMLSERQYLRQFTDDLLAGKYTDEGGNPKIRQIRNRLHSYTGRMTGTANETFVAASIGARIEWRMGGAELHCPDCPDLARNSPYRWDDLPTVPKSNGTKCVYNCRCYLVRSDGVEGFR